VVKSLAWKFLYGFIVTVLGVLSGFVNTNPDIQHWTLAAVLGGLATALVAFVKKFALNAFLNGEN